MSQAKSEKKKAVDNKPTAINEHYELTIDVATAIHNAPMLDVIHSVLFFCVPWHGQVARNEIYLIFAFVCLKNAGNVNLFFRILLKKNASAYR